MSEQTTMAARSCSASVRGTLTGEQVLRMGPVTVRALPGGWVLVEERGAYVTLAPAADGRAFFEAVTDGRIIPTVASGREPMEGASGARSPEPGTEAPLLRIGQGRFARDYYAADLAAGGRDGRRR